MKKYFKKYDREGFVAEAQMFLKRIHRCQEVDHARARLFHWVAKYQFRALNHDDPWSETIVIQRDCARVLRTIFAARSEQMSGFSNVQAMWDLARGISRNDLKPGFYAEMIHLIQGFEGRPSIQIEKPDIDLSHYSGRQAAMVRSRTLNRMWHKVEKLMQRYKDGLDPEVVLRRNSNRTRIMKKLKITESEWCDWRWQVANIIKTAAGLEDLVTLDSAEKHTISQTELLGLPFGITPYYVSLMDDESNSGADRQIRRQVIPPHDYVSQMSRHRLDRSENCDFMLERDTSPVDLVTRRYPAIVILKPFNTCPQICVYCQRNWEIDTAMSKNALAPYKKIESACQYIENNPSIKEVLITGGDPLVLQDDILERIVARVASIASVDMIRIGSRVPVTLPMRINESLVAMLASYRDPGIRDLAVVTHIEHAYEITPELIQAVQLLNTHGIHVYNQQVFTFFTSRRFETVRLRMLLRRCGIHPYYTFVPKGKEETNSYRVPIARILQERKEECRLIPGIRRTDQPVFNIPGLGKNNIIAIQNRDLISILPDGGRLYEFHPWEKHILKQSTYTSHDVPILDYLERLQSIGENPEEYASIWYYY